MRGAAQATVVGGRVVWRAVAESKPRRKQGAGR
jgi:hypothetical protein